MKTASLSGSPREGVGKKGATELRAKGHGSRRLYGGPEQVHFQVNEIQLNKLVFTPETYRLKFEVGSTTYDCVVQDIQFHPVTDRIVHLDLLQISPTSPSGSNCLCAPQEPVKVFGTADASMWCTAACRFPASPIKFQRIVSWTSARCSLVTPSVCRTSTVTAARFSLNDSAVVLGIAAHVLPCLLTAEEEGEGGEGGEEGCRGVARSNPKPLHFLMKYLW